MTDVTLRVLQPNLTTPVAELDQPFGIEWADEGLDVGTLWFSIPHDSPVVVANPTILDRDSVVMLRTDGVDRLPYVIRRRQRERGDVWDTIRVGCLGGVELLRTGLVEYARGVGTGVPSDERPFGWMAVDYDDSGGCWVEGAPYSGGQWREPRFRAKRDQPPDFPDPRAEWIGPAPLTATGSGGQQHTPDDAWYLRHYLVGDYVGTATLFIAADDAHLTYYNGSQVAEGSDFRQLVKVDLNLTGDDVLAMEVTNAPLGSKVNNPTEVVYTIAVVDEDGEIDRVLFRSVSTNLFTTTADEVQSIVLDPDLGPFPWGSSYPSPGGLGGTWTLTFRGQTTGPIAHNASAADVKAALDALSNIDSVTVTGSGTSASPWIVTFDGPNVSERAHPTMTIVHTDLRHNHATTRVRTVTSGKRGATSTGNASAIRTCAFPGEPPGVTVGFILQTLFDEWQARDGIAALSLGFDADVDSRDNPWPEELVFVCQVGNDSILSVAERLRELGVHVWLDAAFVFQAAQPRTIDRSGSVEVGLDVAHELVTETEDERINALLVRTDDAWYRRGSAPAGDRREAFLTLGLQPNARAANRLADAELAALNRARQVVRFAVNSAQPTAPEPYVDFDPLDELRAPYLLPNALGGGTWALTTVRVDTIAGRVDVLGDVEWVYEVEA